MCEMDRRPDATRSSQVSISNNPDVMLDMPNQEVADCTSRHWMGNNIAPSPTFRVRQVFKQALGGLTNGIEFGN